MPETGPPSTTLRDARAWRPVLSEDEAAVAGAAAADIARALAPAAASLGYDLADGAAGVALLFGYLARVTGDAGQRDIAGALLDQAGDRLATAPSSASLFHGFPGVAWAADHLRSLFGEADLALNDEIDAAVGAWLDAAGAQGAFDLVSGLVGLGVYALERAGWPAADRCADRAMAQLAATAQRGPEGLVWTSPDRPNRTDLGFAHGIPGVIAWLARYVARGGDAGTARHAGTARELLEGAVVWLLAQRRSDTGFPPCVIDGVAALRGRSGWCYGDAAVALALVRASRVGDGAWFDAGLDIARVAATIPVHDTGVRDASLCHGASALALIFQRLYHATGDVMLRSAARDWTMRILDYRLDRSDLAASAGFFQATTEGPRAVPGLLNGAAGIGLVLLAASSDVAPDWDRMLLLSG